MRSENLERKLKAVLQRQFEEVAKDGLDLFKATEADELGAILRLAENCFGKGNVKNTSGPNTTWGGMVEVDRMVPGWFYVGYYCEPPYVPNQKRKRKLVLRGAKVSHLEEQAKLLGLGKWERRESQSRRETSPT